MRQLKLFLGSSTAAKSQAKTLAASLESEAVSFLPWWESFRPGRTLLEELDSIRAKVDGAILLLSPDVPTLIRGRPGNAPNLNVLFEFGYFYGHFGKARVALVRYGDVYLPNDLDGYIHIHGSNGFRSASRTKTSNRTQAEFDRWLESFPHAKAKPSKAAHAQVEPKVAPAKKRRSSPSTESDQSLRKPNAAFMKPMAPSPSLAAVIGNKPMPRTEVTLRVWDYIKKHGLQDAQKKTMINSDEKLRKVFGGQDQVSMFEMAKLVNGQLK